MHALSWRPAAVTAPKAARFPTARLHRFGHASLLVAALALWLLSLRDVDLGGLTDYGLLFAMPATYPIAAALLCAGFVWAVRLGSTRLMSTYLVAFVVVIYATVPLLYTEPRYSYVYKHIAVIHHFESYQAIDRSIDIYHNWPGFLAASAFFARIAGIDPVHFANWTQLLFPLCNVLAMRYVFGALTTDPRRIYGAIWIYLLAAWVEHGYLAPQSFAFFATLVVTGIALRCLRAQPDMWHQQLIAGIVGRLRTVADRWWPTAVTEPADEADSGKLPGPLATVLILAICAAVVVSHQLTPFFLLVNLTILVFAGRCRAWWLVIGIGVLTAIWIWLGYPYLASHGFDLFSGRNPLSNVQPSNVAEAGPPSAGHSFVATAARTLTLVVLAGAVFGAWRDRRNGRRYSVVIALALAPLLLVLVQSYGGEAIYRIYLFMLPWLSFLAAGLFATGRRPMRTRHAAGLFAGSVLSALLLLTSYFGLERVNYMRPEEVAATEWFEQHARDGSIMTFLVLNSPYPLGARYHQHITPYGHFAEEALTDPRFLGRSLGPADVDSVHQLVSSFGAAKTYLTISASQIAYAEGFGYVPIGGLAPLIESLLASDQFRVVFHQGDAYVLEVLNTRT